MALRKTRQVAPLLLVTGLGLTAWIAACGTEGGSKFGDGSQNPGDDASFGSSGFNTTSSSGASSSSGDGSATNGEQLRIEPSTITVKATGSLASFTGTQQFTAYVGASTTPVSATWSVDDAGIGSIETAGLFRTATFGGTTKVRAQVGNLVGLATVTVVLELEEDLTAGGAGALTEAQKTALKAGGTADATNFKWLYPYDKTVFPRGLLPPKLMFAGAAPSGYWVRLRAKNLEYSGFYPGGGNAARVTVSDAWWNAITRSVGANDPVTIDVTKIQGTNVTGPITETWNIAQGSLKGTVFYNTYNSTLVKAANGEGAIMRLKPGSPVEVFLSNRSVTNDLGETRTTRCIVCHSVSANGTALAAGIDWDGPNGSPIDSALFTIGTTGAATTRKVTNDGRALPFGALSPDGNWLVGNASREAAWIRGLGKADTISRLYDATTGTLVDDSFFGAANNRKAVAPAFSPDGKKLAFGDRVVDANGLEMTIADADLASSPPRFTSAVRLARSTTGQVVGWPSFLPDSKAVLYQEGTAYDTGGHTEAAQLRHYCADMKWVDVATKIPALLDRLNGYEPNGTGGKRCYLPYCDVPDPDPNPGAPTACNTEDAHMNYEPTVLPVAVGGYYWVVFTSRRAYGNFINRQAGVSVSPEGDVPFDNTQESGTNAIKGYRKKLWVAAIDINGTPGTDPSHPAFLLEGQETAAGNMRGFWALDPCKADGAGCEGGDECCNGFCRAVKGADGGTSNACVPPPTGCANDSERCTVNADCCTALDGTTCINGVCTVPTPTIPK